jgi:hypothetical protein
MLEALDSPIRQTLPGRADEPSAGGSDRIIMKRFMALIPKSQRLLNTLFSVMAQTTLLGIIQSSTKLNVQFS